jgi:general secretion pathway protein F
MPLYEYKAYDKKGKLTEGIIDAPSRSEAYARLKKKGIYPTTVEEESGTIVSTFSAKREDLAFCLNQLATLLRSGVPLTQALESLMMQVEHKDLRLALTRVRTRLQEGDSFAQALSENKVFPPLLVRMVEAGETIGALDSILDRFADFLEKEANFMRKLLAALTYPIIILAASLGLVFFILTYVAPTLMEIFENFKRSLPVTTIILLGIGNFLRSYFYLVIAALIVLIFVYIRFVPRAAKDSLKLKLPLIGKVYQHTILSRWARTLAMLHGGGVALPKAMSSAREVTDNVIFQKYLLDAEKSLEKGETLTNVLREIPLIPPLIISMVNTGEKSGELEKMLQVAAGFYEKETERRLAVFLQALEPLMIIFLGLVVGFVVISILLPIFDINSIIR